MTAIVVKSFNGLKPIVEPRLLQAEDAQTANNVRLISGALKPLRGVSALKSTTSANPVSIYRYGSKVTQQGDELQNLDWHEATGWLRGRLLKVSRSGSDSITLPAGPVTGASNGIESSPGTPTRADGQTRLQLREQQELHESSQARVRDLRQELSQQARKLQVVDKLQGQLDEAGINLEELLRSEEHTSELQSH